MESFQLPANLFVLFHLNAFDTSECFFVSS